MRQLARAHAGVLEHKAAGERGRWGAKHASVQQILAERERRGKALAVIGANTRIWAERSGKAVACMHGVPASAFVYRKILPALASRGSRGIAFDSPGLGFAAHPGGFDCSSTGLADWMVNALDAAGLDDFHLVVHDIAGPVGFDVVRQIPERICSLTLLNAFLRVAAFRRPPGMAPFAVAGFGWPRLLGMRTPVIVALMRLVGMHDGPGNDELRAYGVALIRGDGGRAFLRIMRGFELTPESERRITAGLRQRKIPARKMNEHAPAIREVPGLPDGHRLHGSHFVQEHSPQAIASHVAALAGTATA